MKKLTLNSNAFKKGEVLTRAQLKSVMGGNGSGLNPNCWPGNAEADYYCCIWGSVYNLGFLNCQTASDSCGGMGGYMITSDPSRCS